MVWSGTKRKGFLAVTMLIAISAAVIAGGASARTTKALISGPNCTAGGNLCVLSPSASNALAVSGGSSLTVSKSVVVNSSASQAALLTNGSKVVAGAIGGPGGFLAMGGSSFSPAPVNVPAQPDPYAASAEPPHNCSGGSSLLAMSPGQTASPGTYSQLGAMIGGTLTLAPGNYTITSSFSNAGNGVITGTGVTLYFCPGAGVTLSGTSSTTLSAPGGSSGFVIFFDRTDTAGFTTFNVTANFTGIIYAKSASMTMGNLNVNGDVAANTVLIHSAGTVVITPPPPPPTPPNIYFGYADNYFTHGNPSGLPWLGLSNTLVLGCGVNPNGGGAAADACPKEPTNTSIDSYDSGAIRIDNVDTHPLVVTGASVQIGACSYNPWPGLNISVAPGSTLVLTQTGGPNPCGTTVVGNYNFDTSESFFALTGYVDGSGAPCSNDGAIPVVTLTTSQGTIVIHDTGQILNTGGIDPPDCALNHSEFHGFTQVSP